jgi:hypothetical protein
VHISWDGSEAQNDKSTTTFTGVAGSVIGGTLGTVTKVQVDGLCVCEDEVTPIRPAAAQFQDDGPVAGSPQPDGLAVTDAGATGTPYKVVFLAFPFEEFGTGTNQTALVHNVNAYFAAP